MWQVLIVYRHLLIKGNVLMHHCPVLQWYLKILMKVVMKRIKTFNFATNFSRQRFFLFACFSSSELTEVIISTHFIFNMAWLLWLYFGYLQSFPRWMHAPQVQQYLKTSCMIQVLCLQYFAWPLCDWSLFCKWLFLLLNFLCLFYLGLLFKSLFKLNMIGSIIIGWLWVIWCTCGGVSIRMSINVRWDY